MNVYVLFRRTDFEGEALIDVAGNIQAAKRIGLEVREADRARRRVSRQTWERDRAATEWCLPVSSDERIVIVRTKVRV